jgi:tetratricopeptide (TPR) repeat protein
MRLTMAMAATIVATQAMPAFSQDLKSCADPKDSLQAIKICSDIIRSHPNDAAAYHLRGNALARNGDLGQAIADYTRAIQVNPNYAPAYESRAMALTDKGDYARALPDATKAAELAKLGNQLKPTASVKVKPKTSAWASMKQAQPKLDTPAFNPFLDRTDF